MMSSHNTPFLDTIIDLLEKNMASQEVIDAYIEEGENWESVNQLFVLIATFLEERLKALNSPKKRKSSKGKKGGKNSFSDQDDMIDMSPSRFKQNDDGDAMRSGSSASPNQRRSFH